MHPHLTSQQPFVLTLPCMHLQLSQPHSAHVLSFFSMPLKLPDFLRSTAPPPLPPAEPLSLPSAATAMSEAGPWGAPPPLYAPAG